MKGPGRVNALMVMVGDNLAAEFFAMLLQPGNAILGSLPDKSVGVFRCHPINTVVMVPQEQNVGPGPLQHLKPFEGVPSQILMCFRLRLPYALP
jgi:hypothetical protein